MLLINSWLYRVQILNLIKRNVNGFSENFCTARGKFFRAESGAGRFYFLKNLVSDWILVYNDFAAITQPLKIFVEEALY